MGKEAATSLLSAIPVKKKPMKMKKRVPKNKNHHLFTKVVDYLMSDSFMFAPLCSPQFDSFPSVSSGIEENEPVEGNDEKLVAKIEDYLKSDTFLYAPLVIPQPWDVTSAASTTPVAKGPITIVEELEKKRSADALKGVTGKADESGRKMVDVVSKDQNAEAIPHRRSSLVTRTRVRRETVKHMVYQNC